jgi:hypothetical protein
MRKLLVGLVFAALVFAPSALAGSANGGGRGTVDGANPFSDFGFAVGTGAGGVQGSFNCLMAGSSQFPGFTLMAVRGQIRAAAIGAGAASFDGAGMFQTGNQGKAPATFHVEVTAGGPGVGTLRLTLLTPFFFPLPTEHVLVGGISIR